MSNIIPPDDSEPAPADRTPADRVKRMVDQLFAGNRTAFAHEIGMSHAAVFKLYAGKPAGKRLLCAVSKRFGVSLDWLMHGHGDAIPPPPQLYPPGTAPVSDELLAGRVDVALGRSLPTVDLGRLSTPTQYWLEIGPGQAIAALPSHGVLPGTLLLLETDRKWFPPPNAYDGVLCVVGIPSRAPREEGPTRVLAEVRYLGDTAEHPFVLAAHPFESRDEATEVACDVTVRVLPGGRAEVTGVTRRRVERAWEKGAPAPEPDGAPKFIAVRREDVLAVWTGLAYRPQRRLRG